MNDTDYQETTRALPPVVGVRGNDLLTPYRSLVFSAIDETRQRSADVARALDLRRMQSVRLALAVLVRRGLVEGDEQQGFRITEYGAERRRQGLRPEFGVNPRAGGFIKAARRRHHSAANQEGVTVGSAESCGNGAGG